MPFRVKSTIDRVIGDLQEKVEQLIKLSEDHAKNVEKHINLAEFHRVESSIQAALSSKAKKIAENITALLS